jgi:hypothetical protein
MVLVAGAWTVFTIWDHWLGGAAIVDASLHDRRATFYATLASITGSLLGFVITSISVVATAIQSDRFAPVRDSRHYPKLWQALFGSVRALAAATVVALLAVLIDQDKTPQHWYVDAVVLTLLWACARLGRSTMILRAVVAPSRLKQ